MPIALPHENEKFDSKHLDIFASGDSAVAIYSPRFVEAQMSRSGYICSLTLDMRLDA